MKEDNLRKLTPSAVAAYQRRYRANRAIFIPGAEVERLLRSMGATQDALDEIRHIGEKLGADPTLPFRRSASARFAFRESSRVIERLLDQPFVLTAAEDFVRHDSGQKRLFDRLVGLEGNNAFQALLRFKALVTSDVTVRARSLLDYERADRVCTVFALRTITRPDLIGEPALEGVHTDGVDHTMTTFIASENLREGSATTRMHAMTEQTGIPASDVDPDKVLGEVCHRRFLDTLIVVDNERKHSVTPAHACDDSALATRDMLIFFTRQPVVEGHPSSGYDSLDASVESPMSVPY